MAKTAWLDGVFAPLHVGCSGGEAMAIPRVGTGGAGVRVVKSQSMSPAVKHLHSVVSDDMWGCSRGAMRLVCRCRHGVCANGGIGTVGYCIFGNGDVGQFCGKIGTMIPDLGCHEFLQMLFVFVSEMLSEFNEHLVGCRFYAPHVACNGEYSGGLKHEQC